LIFISHTHSDKPIVEPFANRLAEVYGIDHIFYDSWSIQPGEGIIEKIDQGLSTMNIFFFFVSERSLESNLVKLEWQNALLIGSKGKIKLIPVKLDGSKMPSILTQTLYLDVYINGFEVVLRQMIDVIEGRNIYQSKFDKYENVKAYVQRISEREMKIVIKAETYMEPISRYGIVVLNEEKDVKWRCTSDTFFLSGFNEKAATVGTKVGVIQANVLAVTVQRSTVPGFPIEISLTSTKPILFLGVVKADASEKFSDIPLFQLPESKSL